MYLVKNLVQGSLLTTSAAVYYTVPAGVNTQLMQMTFTNVNAAAQTISLYLVDDASSPTDPDTIVKDKTLQPSETWSPFSALGAVLAPGCTIQAICSANSAVALKASGIEITT